MAAEATTQLPRVGFIGLGVMGRPMASNLLRAGYPLVVHSRSRGPVQALVRAGATEAFSPREVAAQVDVLVTMLPSGRDVAEVLVDGHEPVASGAQQGLLLIDMSTIEPSVTRAIGSQFAARDIGFVDAPVSGGEAGALNGTLSIMVGGDQRDYERATPLFVVLGGSVAHVGPIGAGQTLKACNQLIVASNIEAVAEALTLAARAGLDLETCRTVLLGGFAGSRVLEVHGQRMIDRNFRPGFRVRLHKKDAGIIEGLADEVGVRTPAFDVAKHHLRALDATGDGDLDHSALLRAVEGLVASERG